MNRKILRLAVPNIISNITVPLLGMVDLAIIGRLGDDSLIGGMAIGTTIFNFLYWNFSFLRMGTSGFAAQAYGARNLSEAARTLVRAALVALAISIVIVALQLPIDALAMRVMEGSSGVEQAASRYFLMRIWAAPATLMLNVMTGWFIGMQNSRTPMWIAIVINVINVVMSLLAVWVLDMGIAGVAFGTVIAQWSGLVMALVIVWRNYGRIFSRERLGSLSSIMAPKVMGRFFRVNRDIFLRTICLVAVFTYFTIASSAMGDTLLSVNTLMLQLFTLFSYMMDGFAYAGEALSGRYYGAGSTSMLRRAVRALLWWGVGVMAIFTVIYGLWAPQILSLFTPSVAILTAAGEYALWAALVPVCSFLAFTLDGIIVGITATYIMRNAMFAATALFFVAYFVLTPAMGNNGLWVAFLLFLLARGVGQMGWVYRRVIG